MSSAFFVLKQKMPAPVGQARPASTQHTCEGGRGEIKREARKRERRDKGTSEGSPRRPLKSLKARHACVFPLVPTYVANVAKAAEVLKVPGRNLLVRLESQGEN